MATKVAIRPNERVPGARQASPRVVLDARVVTGTGGGPDKTILNSPRFLKRDGYHMICAYMHPPGDVGFEELRRRAHQLDATLLPVPDRGALDGRVFARLLEVCRAQNVSIWHGHDYKSNLIGLLLRRFWPMHLVTTCHGWVRHTRRTPIYYALDRISIRYYERVFCVSEDLRDACIRAGARAERCVLLPNGIDVDQVRRVHSRDAAKRALGVPTDQTLVGAVGRLSEEKGFSVLIRAIDGLIRQGRDLSLCIAGEGEQEEELTGLIQKLGQEDRIRLVGFQSDLGRIYEALDIFALSSLREGLPNVLLEALAYEIPVVATRVNGVPAALEPYDCGELCEPGRDDELARAIVRVCDDPNRSKRMVRNGRLAIEQQYSFASRMSSLARMYDELMEREAL